MPALFPAFDAIFLLIALIYGLSVFWVYHSNKSGYFLASGISIFEILIIIVDGTYSEFDLYHLIADFVVLFLAILAYRNLSKKQPLARRSRKKSFCYI